MTRRLPAPALAPAIALAMSLFAVCECRAIQLEAVADTWIRENSPSSAFDADLISIWATPSDRRHGAVMFDLSSTGSTPITSAYLELFDRVDSRSKTLPLTQQAFILQTTPPEIEGYTWEEYITFDQATEAALTGLGSYDIAAGDLIDGFEPSGLATGSDLTLLQNVRASQSGRVVFILKASEGERDWGDIEFEEAPPRLILNEPLPVYGDFNDDNAVTAVDFDILVSPTNWLQDVQPGSAGDLSADGVVDLRDFSLFKPVYLAANPGASLQVPVPEPTSLAAALVGSLALAIYRRL
jgi:hypothetical protein